MIVAYDKPGNHHRDRRNVLFVRSQVRKVKGEELQQAIARDNELRRELGLKEKPLGQ